MAGEFLVGLVERELPVDGRSPGVPLGHAGIDMGGEFVPGGDALVQALAGDGGAFELNHVEPGGIFGRVVDLEARGQSAGIGAGRYW